MGLAAKVSRLIGRKRDCEHVDSIQDVTPSSLDSCNRCVALGDEWVHLRMCLICGEVGCCDNSKNTHATKHFHSTGHPLIQSYEPGETWRYCYADDVMVRDALALR